MNGEHELRTVLGQLLKLVEDGVLIRNTRNDDDAMTYMRESLRLVATLKQAQEVLQ